VEQPSRRRDPSLPAEFFEQELPADFAALGEQLTADAQRLAEVYPPCAPPLEWIEALDSQSRRASLPRQIAALASAAAGILLVLGLIGFALSPVWLNQLSEVSEPPKSVNPPAELVHQPTLPEQADLLPVMYRPAVVDMDGPELEGWLDLYQEQSESGATISF
jgi:hypothetical protein